MVRSILIDGETAIDGGDLTLILLPTPGHTPDHLAVLVPELRLLHAGDASEFPFPTISENGSLADLRASLRALEALSPRTVLCCHDPGVSDASLLRRNIAYLDEVERRVRAGQEFPFEEAVPAGFEAGEWDYSSFHAENLAAARRLIG